VFDEQLQPHRQPDLPRCLVHRERAVTACVCSDATGRPAGGQGRSSAGATAIDVEGHPGGVRRTDLIEAGSADVHRHPARGLRPVTA